MNSTQVAGCAPEGSSAAAGPALASHEAWQQVYRGAASGTNAGKHIAASVHQPGRHLQPPGLVAAAAAQLQ